MINREIKSKILELCGILLNEDLCDNIDIDEVNDDYIAEILECALEHLDNSVIFTQEDWEQELMQSVIH